MPLRTKFVFAASLTVAAALAAPAMAQYRPPGEVPGAPAYGGGVDAASLLVRINRLESEVRALTGQVEQMQYQYRRLEEQLRRAQGGDGASGPQRRGDAGPGATPEGQQRRGDAFDPSQMPGAPGAPRVLGSIESGASELPPAGRAAPGAPLDLLSGAPSQAGQYPIGQPSGGPITGLSGQTLPPATPGRTQTAARIDPGPAPPNGPRAEYEVALAALRSNNLDEAESGLKGFLGRYPTSQLAASANYNLGEVYARRNRHREAAEQFLKVTTDFSKASQAPQSLLRLGESLEKLGAKEQACAAWAEIGRKYPTAPSQVRSGAERDMKRAQC